MPKLPSAVDVPKVQLSGDPGVRIPDMAFQSPMGTVSKELAPAIETLSKVKLQQENRRDTIDRSDSINQYTLDADDELRRLNAEEDLSREDVLAKYGSYLTQKRQELLEGHGGSQESRAVLHQRLLDEEASATGRAAGVSAKIGRDKIKTTFQNSLTPLTIKASADPSLKNLDSVYTEFEDKLNDLKGAIDPQEEEALRRAGREQITLSALDPLLVRGRAETAESLLIEGGLARYLSPESQRQVLRRIDIIRYQRDEQLKGLTEREKRVRQLRERGLSKELSEDIAAKDVKVVGPDDFGKFYSVNIAAGTKTEVADEDAEAITRNVEIEKLKDKGISEDAAIEIVDSGILKEPKGAETDQGADSDQAEAIRQTEQSIEAAVQKGTGPFANIQQMVSNVLGPFIEGAMLKDTTDARQQLRVFNQTAKMAFVNNPKFPVAEQEIVSRFLPDPDKFFQDPDTARANFRQLRTFLNKAKAAKTKEMGKRTITTKRKADLSDQISSIEEILNLMGAEEIISVSTQEEVDKLEKGQLFKWLDGNTYTKNY